MLIYNEKNFSIFFGDAISCPVARKAPEFKAFCATVQQHINCEKIIFLNQVRENYGIYLNQENLFTNTVSLYEQDGDYLITNQHNVALGISTADCLPIIFYDTRNNIIAIAHAGWQGSVGKIGERTIEHMYKIHRFQPHDIIAIFGPSAKACCYEVQPEFLEKLSPFGWYNHTITRRGEKLFFDLPLFNKLQLIDLGINPQNINLKFNECTICNTKYHSNRRNGHAEFCQTTIAWLH